MVKPQNLSSKPRLKWKLSAVDGLFGIFKDERSMCDFIEHNIELFTLDVLNEELVSYEREYSFGENVVYKRSRPTRVDFYIETKNHKAIIEVKNKCNTNACRSIIGQILSYGTKGNYNKLIVVLPGVNDILIDTIDKYELPIEVVMLTNKQIGRWSKAIQKTGEIQVSHAIS